MASEVLSSYTFTRNIELKNLKYLTSIFIIKSAKNKNNKCPLAQGSWNCRSFYHFYFYYHGSANISVIIIPNPIDTFKHLITVFVAWIHFYNIRRECQKSTAWKVKADRMQKDTYMFIKRSIQMLITYRQEHVRSYLKDLTSIYWTSTLQKMFLEEALGRILQFYLKHLKKK